MTVRGATLGSGGALSPSGLVVHYGREIEGEIAYLQALIASETGLVSRYPSRWLAIKLLERDSEIGEQVVALLGKGAPILAAAADAVVRLEEALGDEVDILIADRRYGFIGDLVRHAVQRPAVEQATLSDRIDAIVTHRLFGIPILLAAMWVVFQMTANVSASYIGWLEELVGGPISRWAAALLDAAGLAETWFASMVVDGVIAGVGGVIVFVPVLLFLYFFLALLEDSGYMARAAFVMDRLMHALGLHGKSFLPMLVGFGCSVTGVYATRTLENEDDRVLTGLLVPMMSCGARLPVYAVFAAAFFPALAGQFIFALYVTGIVAAILSGLLLKRTLFRRKTTVPFVMELPPYRVPTVRAVWTHMWERTGSFVRRAATVIVAVSIMLWFLMSLPWGVESTRDSYFGQASAALSPVFAPAGFDRWEASGALVTGFVAKEVVLSTLSQVYGLEGEEGEEVEATFVEDLRWIATSFWEATRETVRATASLLPGVSLAEEAEEADAGLVQALRGAFTPLQAIAFSVFVLLYVPCMVTVAAMRHEYGTRWTLFGSAYLMALGWIAATAVYQGGRLLGLG
jgi:ferrous iron transport protein B